jgi:hypothetical protein
MDSHARHIKALLALEAAGRIKNEDVIVTVTELHFKVPPGALWCGGADALTRYAEGVAIGHAWQSRLLLNKMDITFSPRNAFNSASGAAAGASLHPNPLAVRRLPRRAAAPRPAHIFAHDAQRAGGTGTDGRNRRAYRVPCFVPNDTHRQSIVIQAHDFGRSEGEQLKPSQNMHLIMK